MKISWFCQKIRGFAEEGRPVFRGLFSILVFIPVLLIPGCGEAPSEDLIELQEAEVSELPEEGSLPEGVGEDFTYVYVCGRVNNPGVYSVSDNCRVFECLQLAGGLCEDADISCINQAQRVSDGQQLYVPSVEEMRALKEEGTGGGLANINSTGSGSGLVNINPQDSGAGLININSTDSGDGLVNINTADLDGLTKITGIGKTRAQSILEYREQNGRFEKIEDIMKVPGIKEGLFSKISGQIRVD